MSWLDEIEEDDDLPEDWSEVGPGWNWPLIGMLVFGIGLWTWVFCAIFGGWWPL